MTIALVRTPYEPILGLNALGLTGHVLIGQEFLDPADYPKAVYWDSAGLQPAEQPIDVQGGYPMRDGTPARLYVDGRYSILAETMNHVQVWRSNSEGPEGTVQGEGSYECGFDIMGEVQDGDFVTWNFVRAVSFADDFAGAYGCGRATSAATCTIKKNCTLDGDGQPTGGTTVGTIVYATDGSAPAFATTAGAISVAAGDRYFFIFDTANGLMNPSATLLGAVVTE